MNTLEANQRLEHDRITECVSTYAREQVRRTLRGCAYGNTNLPEVIRWLSAKPRAWMFDDISVATDIIARNLGTSNRDKVRPYAVRACFEDASPEQAAEWFMEDHARHEDGYEWEHDPSEDELEPPVRQSENREDD